MVASASPDRSKKKAVALSQQSVEFFQYRWVQNVLPLMTSLIVHLSILAVGIALYQVVTEVKTAAREQVTIPQSTVIARPDLLAGIPMPKMIEMPAPEARQNKVVDSASDGISEMPRNNLIAFKGGGSDEPSISLGVQQAGGGIGNPFDSGGAGIAPFGPPSTSTQIHIGGKQSAGTGRRVIFLCDASGSMLGVFGTLKQNLKESISNLKLEDGAEFNIIFFSDGNCFPLFKDSTQLATDENKKEAIDFIDAAVSTGGTRPMPAIRFALAEKPDLLFVLTDGFDQIASLDEVVAAFRNGNKDKKIQINTIFLESDEDPKLEKALMKIAEEGRGSFVKVPKAEM